jgi:hypothetical protein
LEFLRLTQAHKSAEFLNSRVAKYGQVRAQNPNPFLVPSPLNPSFLPPIQFRFLSQETPCLAFNSRSQDLSIEISLSQETHAWHLIQGLKI